MSGISGIPLEGLAAGKPGMSLEGLVVDTDGFLVEDLLAFYVKNFFSGLKVSSPSGCSSNRRALCLLYVELNSGCILCVHGYPCRIGAEESCRTSSCIMQFLEVSVKTAVPLFRMEHF